MKHLVTLLFFIASVTSIVLGYVLEVPYTEKLKGFGVLGLFFITIPFFIYHSWKGKNPKDYMLTNENLERMRNKEKKK